MADIDMLTTDEIRNNLSFKYYKVDGGTSWLHAVYESSSKQEHSIIVIVPPEFVATIDNKIFESLLAMQSYAYEHPEDSKPAEIISGSPRKVSKQPDEGTVVVKAKTPRELEKEAEDEIDRQALEN